MELPKYHEIIEPALRLLTTTDEIKLREFELPLAQHFNLTDEQVQQEYESGNGRVFYDRISWALSYLNMAGLITKPKRGIYKISEEGKRQLQNPDGIFQYIQNKLAEREPTRGKNTGSDKDTLISDPELTPEESLYNAFDGIKKSIYKEILDTILSKSPREFEKVVVQLLQLMGYGGEIEDSGIVTQYSNDKGIDGVIKEDILGLGRIHIQAKRYSPENTVSRQEIQSFVGALAAAQSTKGVFITTSSFSRGAVEYSRSLNATTTIVLIDGEELAGYIYQFGLGMQTEKTIEIKKLDTDFWDQMLDDK